MITEEKKVNKEGHRNPLLQIRVMPNLLERLEKVANMYGVTKKEIASTTIAQYLKQILGTLDRIADKMTGKSDGTKTN